MKELVTGNIEIKIGGLTLLKAAFTLTFKIAPAENQIAISQSEFDGTVGAALSGNVGMSGGNGALSMNVPDPTQIPPGVSLDANGNVSGTPTAAGTFEVGVEVSDSQG